MTTAAVGRFAPSTTGPAHPGTLLAAVLCWLDARSRGGRVVLRLEDLDPDRCRPEFADAMIDALAWLGLDWDGVSRQSDHAAAHDEAMDRLAAGGLLYPCSCSRADIRQAGLRAADGTFRYPGTCRSNALPAGGWRAAGDALRVRLTPGFIDVRDESGLDLGADAATAYGDPVARRRDGAIAYHLASVVDDHGAGVTRVVRGRDLAPSTAVQVALQALLGWPRPAYRHHLLLLEARGDKLAKFHGAVGVAALRDHYDAPSLLGVLAQAAGLRDRADAVTPSELLDGFSWDGVGADDRVLDWDGERLRLAAG